ncbi:nuclear transport factor 2 family protein [Olivibacter sp. CPCC 100613]|uniref:nuclear transport factor 2 family protein n=1 Tax=Olivibacter sp. CPCC 100613 TaxID=3079931 RepID=UPI002FF919EE
MKTFITSLIVAILFTSTAAFATVPKSAKRSNVAAINYTLDRYTDALSKGQVADLDHLFSEQFNQRFVQREKGASFGKKQLVNFLKKHRNIQQNCETNYRILEETEGMAIAKVEMKYKDFSRIDYVTISHSNEGYQISQVVSTFE